MIEEVQVCPQQSEEEAMQYAYTIFEDWKRILQAAHDKHMLLGYGVRATTFRTKGQYEVAGLPVDVKWFVSEVSSIIAKLTQHCKLVLKFTDVQEPASKRITDVCLAMATKSLGGKHVVDGSKHSFAKKPRMKSNDASLAEQPFPKKCDRCTSQKLFMNESKILNRCDTMHSTTVLVMWPSK